MSVEREAAKTIYLELEEPVEIQKLKEVLEQAGIRTQAGTLGVEPGCEVPPPLSYGV